MKKTVARTSKRAKSSRRTSLRAYRFDVKLITAFEEDCGRHLRNSRTVLEALMHRWLAATAQERDAIAAEYQRHSHRNSK